MATEKKINLRRFIQKSVDERANALSWLKKHNEYLRTFSGVTEILSAAHNNEISPDQAFSKVMEILVVRLMNEVIDNLNAPSSVQTRSSSKERNYGVELYFSDVNGNESIRDAQKFDCFQRAEDFAVRHLSEDYCGTRAVISGHGFMTEISRTDAIAKFWGGRKRKPTMKKMSFGNKLKFIGKAQQTHSSFSRG